MCFESGAVDAVADAVSGAATEFSTGGDDEFVSGL
jgi:hypothetical protein